MSKSKLELGKGIRALLNNIDEEAAAASKKTKKAGANTSKLRGSVFEIPLNDIEVNPFQPRVEFNEDALRELSESIAIHGVVQPVTVRALSENKFQLIAGERRLRASKLAGKESIPAYVRTANDQEALEIALIENIQREDLNAIEVGITYQRLLDECSLTHDEMAKRLGKSRSVITNYLRLLKLPPTIQTALKQHKLSMGHARCLAGVDDAFAQLDVFNKIVTQKLSVRQTEELIKTYKPTKGIKSAVKENKKLNYDQQKMQDHLESTLSSRVKLKPGKKGSGEIVIYFHSNEDLERITDLLS
ncbi:MAG: ParB/RepB/Spo0J family partition protein [Chitinophagales bacterium]